MKTQLDTMKSLMNFMGYNIVKCECGSVKFNIINDIYKCSGCGKETKKTVPFIADNFDSEDSKR